MLMIFARDFRGVLIQLLGESRAKLSGENFESLVKFSPDIFHVRKLLRKAPNILFQQNYSVLFINGIIFVSV